MRLLAPAVLVLVGVPAVVIGWRSVGWSTPPTARFAYDASTFVETPEDLASVLGGPLTQADIETIKRVSGAELERAFAGLRIRFTDEGRGFWRVRVVPSVVRHGLNGRAIQSAAGVSYALGPLGGGGYLNFTTLALKAVAYAPPRASREDIVVALGRGLGRSAVHEFTHLILGARPAHSDDEGSYEFDSADRVSQFYGELRWAVARPLLEQRLGRAP